MITYGSLGNDLPFGSCTESDMLNSIHKIILIGSFCTALRITKFSHMLTMLRFRSLV